jgi:uncharacterized membrane protein YidH (DUF202 family)
MRLLTNNLKILLVIGKLKLCLMVSVTKIYLGFGIDRFGMQFKPSSNNFHLHAKKVTAYNFVIIYLFNFIAILTWMEKKVFTLYNSKMQKHSIIVI